MISLKECLFRYSLVQKNLHLLLFIFLKQNSILRECLLAAGNHYISQIETLLRRKQAIQYAELLGWKSLGFSPPLFSINMAHALFITWATSKSAVREAVPLGHQFRISLGATQKVPYYCKSVGFIATLETLFSSASALLGGSCSWIEREWLGPLLFQYCRILLDFCLLAFLQAVPLSGWGCSCKSSKQDLTLKFDRAKKKYMLINCLILERGIVLTGTQAENGRV